MAIGAMALVATAGTAKAASVTPTQIDGNPTCKTLLAPEPAFEIKIDPPKSGSYGPITVTFSPDGKLVDFTSTVPVLAVFVKGGNEGGNLYDYRPAGSSGDTGLTTPTNQQISHVSFCWNEPPQNPPKALTATKTAEATYDRKIDWTLNKTVNPAYHSGTAGQSFDSTWSVDATKSVVEENFKVTGKITINNPNDQAVGFSVTDKLDDQTMADVDCDPNTENNQASGTVPANGSVECSYTALPTTKDAKFNNAQVSSTTQGIPGATAQAPVTWQEKVIGDDEVTLADPRFSYSQLISGNTTKTFPETFKCPTDRASYDANRSYTKTFTNTATLKGDNTDKTASATVTLKCTYPWVDETATGIGMTYKGTSNWFMVTKFTTTPVNLIAGQKYDAGDITFTRIGTPPNSTMTINITLQNGFRFANVANNLKIKNFSTERPQYVSPGQFPYKFNCSQALNTCTATGLPDAPYYGIHVDVERPVQ
jgi:hypothetical protein